MEVSLDPSGPTLVTLDNDGLIHEYQWPYRSVSSGMDDDLIDEWDEQRDDHKKNGRNRSWQVYSLTEQLDELDGIVCSVDFQSYV